MFDPVTERWRTLPILKDSVAKFWQEPSVASAGSKSGKAKAKGRGRPDAEIEIHQAVDGLLQRGVNVIDMPWKHREVKINMELSKRKSRRYSLRTLKEYFQSWRKKQRTDI